MSNPKIPQAIVTDTSAFLASISKLHRSEQEARDNTAKNQSLITDLEGELSADQLVTPARR